MCWANFLHANLAKAVQFSKPGNLVHQHPSSFGRDLVSHHASFIQGIVNALAHCKPTTLQNVSKEKHGNKTNLLALFATNFPETEKGGPKPRASAQVATSQESLAIFHSDALQSPGTGDVDPCLHLRCRVC